MCDSCSKLSKCEGHLSAQFSCDYKAVLCKSKAKSGSRARLPWGFKKGTTVKNLTHHENCVSKGRMTVREAKLETKNTTQLLKPQTIEETTNRIASDNKVPKKAISQHCAYQIRNIQSLVSNKNYVVNWSKLDKWGRKFMENNEGSVFHLKCDKQGRFERMFVGIASAVQIALLVGIDFSGIDGTFFRNINFDGGTILLLVTRDGNNKLLLLAWVVCLVEDGKNYKYMAMKCKLIPGLSQYLNRATALVYSDRHAGIPNFVKQFSCDGAHCIVHIIDNLRDYLIGLKRNNPHVAVHFHSDQVHRIQRANTFEKFTKELNLMRRGFPHAAAYLDALDHNKTYAYALIRLGHATHGHNTNNLVESLNGTVEQARHGDPYNFNDWILRWHGERMHERQGIVRLLQEGRKLYTPYASAKVGKSEIMAREENLSVQAEGADAYLVIHRDHERERTRHKVHVGDRTCTCTHWMEHLLPCMHIIVVVDKLELRTTPEKALHFRNTWVPSYFWAENYCKAYANIRICSPLMNRSAGVHVEEGERVVLPPEMSRNLGRKRKKRRSKGRGGTRTRARWQPEEYKQRTRTKNNREGPANPFVMITDPTVFNRKPQGRKGLTRQQCAEGRKEAAAILQNAIDKRKSSASKRKSSASKQKSPAAKRKTTATTADAASTSAAAVAVQPVVSPVLPYGFPITITPQMILQQQQMLAMYSQFLLS